MEPTAREIALLNENFLDRCYAAKLRKIFGGFLIPASKILEDTGIADKSFPALIVNFFQLGKILDDTPELHSETCHEGKGLFDHCEPAQRCHLIQQEKNWFIGLYGEVACINREGLLHQ